MSSRDLLPFIRSDLTVLEGREDRLEVGVVSDEAARPLLAS
jgi:hypothetical protein